MLFETVLDGIVDVLIHRAARCTLNIVANQIVSARAPERLLRAHIGWS